MLRGEKHGDSRSLCCRGGNIQGRGAAGGRNTQGRNAAENQHLLCGTLLTEIVCIKNVDPEGRISKTHEIKDLNKILKTFNRPNHLKT